MTHSKGATAAAYTPSQSVRSGSGTEYTQTRPQAPRASYWTNYKIINGAPVPLEQIPEER